MNKTFMSGYYQGVIETAPATLSAAKTEQLAITMTILHLRHAGISITSIHDFLVSNLHANERFVNKYTQDFYCHHSMCCKPLFPDIRYYPGIILEDREEKKDIYLTHGHQADLLNSTLWPLSRFLVRYVWKPLENLGIPDPTSAAKNNTRKKNSEERLTAWARENRHLLITGHTHHPMIGTVESPYFNTGSCVSPAGITCIEIENRCLTLIKWELGTRNDQTAYVRREVLGQRICIDEY